MIWLSTLDHAINMWLYNFNVGTIISSHKSGGWIRNVQQFLKQQKNVHPYLNLVNEKGLINQFRAMIKSFWPDSSISTANFIDSWIQSIKMWYLRMVYCWDNLHSVAKSQVLKVRLPKKALINGKSAEQKGRKHGRFFNRRTSDRTVGSVWVTQVTIEVLNAEYPETTLMKGKYPTGRTFIDFSFPRPKFHFVYSIFLEWPIPADLHNF